MLACPICCHLMARQQLSDHDKSKGTWLPAVVMVWLPTAGSRDPLNRCYRHGDPKSMPAIFSHSLAQVDIRSTRQKSGGLAGQLNNSHIHLERAFFHYGTYCLYCISWLQRVDHTCQITSLHCNGLPAAAIMWNQEAAREQSKDCDQTEDPSHTRARKHFSS